MNALGFRQFDDRERQIEGCAIVLGSLLRGLHPAEAFVWVAKVAAEGGVPCDVTLLGAEGDTDRFIRAVGNALPMHEDGAHLGSGAYARVIESEAS